MRRHAESNNVILFAVHLEIGGVVAAMAVEDEEAIDPGCSSSGVLVEVLNPFMDGANCTPCISQFSESVFPYFKASLN